jgi:hypothetical protein
LVFNNGTITKFAGTGTGGYNGDGIPATHTGLNYSSILTKRNGELYIADTNDSRISSSQSSCLLWKQPNRFELQNDTCPHMVEASLNFSCSLRLWLTNSLLCENF